MKKMSFVLIALAICIGLLQFIKPQETEYTPVKKLTGIPEEVNSILRQSCFNCHSTETNLEWYDKITPANFLVYNHIKKGRNALNFSNWDSLSPAQQNAKLYYSLNKILEEEMPLPSYTAIHKNAKVSNKDIQVLKRFLIARTPRKTIDSIQINEVNKQFSDFINQNSMVPEKNVEPAANGIEYISDYRNWTTISVTDRFDNETIRIIYGNEIAIKAIQERNIKPWPKGAILAKAAWKQMTNSDGSISTGEFIQVEFMIKDEKKYAQTAGWGWARWRGIELKPYGGKTILTTECTSCHKPMKENDFVFTKPFYLKNYQQKFKKNEK